MKKWVLRIRQDDKPIFDALVSGAKTIETRAGTVRYQKIQKGDILIMSCGKDLHEFRVEKITHYHSAKALFDEISFTFVLPNCSNQEEAENTYDSFNNYRDKIRQYGIFAFHLVSFKKKFDENR